LIAVAHSTIPGAVVVCLTAAVGFGGFAWAGFRYSSVVCVDMILCVMNIYSIELIVSLNGK
jgi:hypothetical protein